MLHFWRINENLGALHYWTNKSQGGEIYPDESIDDYLVQNGRYWIELHKPNTNFNTEDFNVITIVSKRENNKSDYLQISDDETGFHRYYYLNNVAKSLNRKGAITYTYNLDEWATFGFMFHNALKTKNLPVYFTRKHMNRFLKETNEQGEELRWVDFNTQYYLNTSEPDIELQVSEVYNPDFSDTGLWGYKVDEILKTSFLTYNNNEKLKGFPFSTNNENPPSYDTDIVGWYEESNNKFHKYFIVKLPEHMYYIDSGRRKIDMGHLYAQMIGITTVPDYQTNNHICLNSENVIGTFLSKIPITYLLKQLKIRSHITYPFDDVLLGWADKYVLGIIPFNPKQQCLFDLFKGTLFETKIKNYLNNIKEPHCPTTIENEPILLNQANLFLEYRSDEQNSIICKANQIDLKQYGKITETVEQITILLLVSFLQGIYLGFRPQYINLNSKPSEVGDEITILESFNVPVQCTATMDYLATSATTWDTQRANIENTYSASTQITQNDYNASKEINKNNNISRWTNFGLNALTSGTTGAGAGMMFGGPIGAIIGGVGGLVGNIGSAVSGAMDTKNAALQTENDYKNAQIRNESTRANSLRSLNSEIENINRSPKHLSIPSICKGLLATTDITDFKTTYNTGMNVYTMELNEKWKYQIYFKTKKYGYLYNGLLPYHTYDNRNHFNMVQIDPSYNYTDLFRTLKEIDKFNYVDLIIKFIDNYLGDGFIVMHKYVDILNDEENWEKEFPESFIGLTNK